MEEQQIQFFKGLFGAKIQELMASNSSDPGICAALQELSDGEPMTQSARIAVEAGQEVFDSEEDDFGVTKEVSCDGFLIAATFHRTERLPIVARAFPGGYYTWLTEAFERADRHDARSAFAHWILVMDSANVVVHLTVTQRDKTKFKILAWDLLNPTEMKRIYGNDPRPSSVKAQWDL